MKLSIFDSVFPRSQQNINHFSVGEQSMPYAFSQPVTFFNDCLDSVTAPEKVVNRFIT